MKKLVYLGGKNTGLKCLKMLLQEAGEYGWEVIQVIGTPGPRGDYLLHALQGKNIPFTSRLEELKQCDLLLSVQYGMILSAEDISKAGVALNLHMAPLPEYRGCNQFSHAIMDGAKQFGTTIHQLVPEIDKGPIFFQKR